MTSIRALRCLLRSFAATARTDEVRAELVIYRSLPLQDDGFVGPSGFVSPSGSFDLRAAVYAGKWQRDEVLEEMNNIMQACEVS